MRKNFREESRKNYHTDLDENVGFSCEQLQTGALLRIADATELMAQKYQKLINERDMWKNMYEVEWGSHRYTVRQIRALRGVITKLRKRAGNQGGAS